VHKLHAIVALVQIRILQAAVRTDTRQSGSKLIHALGVSQQPASIAVCVSSRRLVMLKLLPT